MLDFLILLFSLAEFQGDKLSGLGVQVPWQEWAEICNQEQHMAGLLLAEVTWNHSFCLLSALSYLIPLNILLAFF